MLYDAIVTSAHVSDGNVKSVDVYTRSGFSTYFSKYFIDCTGDGNLCVQAGASFHLGRDDDHLCQPMTLCFWVGNVNKDGFKKILPKINPL